MLTPGWNFDCRVVTPSGVGGKNCDDARPSKRLTAAARANNEDILGSAKRIEIRDVTRSQPWALSASLRQHVSMRAVEGRLEGGVKQDGN